MRRIPSLPSRDHHRQRLLPLLDREVDLACQPAARPAESVVGRLDEDASGRLLPELPRPGRVLVGPAHVPSDPRGRSVRACPATGRPSGSATVCRLSAAFASTPADGPVLCPAAATAQAGPTAHSSDPHAPQNMIINEQDPLSQQALVPDVGPGRCPHTSYLGAEPWPTGTRQTRSPGPCEVVSHCRARGARCLIRLER
jgi:hypothetical protein